MNLVYKNISTTEPVLLTDAKIHLGLVDTYYDTLINRLISAARERAETFLNRSLVDKTVVVMLDDHPDNMYVKLPKGPIKSITNIKYWDGSEMQTLSSDNYEHDIACDPGILYFLSMISDLERKVNCIHIEYTVGWGDRTISGHTVKTPMPQPVISAMLMMIRTMFDMREDLVKGITVARVPQNAEFLLSPYRVFEFL